MDSTTQEVITFIEENDVKFIRLAFCDVLGRQKNISVMPSQITRVFEDGISFDAAAVLGFKGIAESDLFLFPDATTLDILPWRPQVGRVIRFFCDIRYGDGTPFENDTRSLLKNKLYVIKEKGMRVMTGMECEFYLFSLDEKGQPTLRPMDQGAYLDIAPKDKGEDIRREICLTLEEMGIMPESSHHEQGPGQNEIDFHFDDALISCDHYMTFKWAVETIADSNDLYASFMPKPLKDKSGSGLHINLSLAKNNRNIFAKEQPELFHQFIAGILAHIREITLFLNPDRNSYERLGEYEAPMYISWSHRNRSALIRIPDASPAYMRCEVRSPDNLCNPYLAVYLLLCAGMEGIEKQLVLQEESHGDLNAKGSEFPTIPLSLEEALDCAKESSFLKKHLPESLLEFYLTYMKKEHR